MAGAVILGFSVVAMVLAGLAVVPFGLAGLVLYRKPYLALRGRTALGSTARSQVLGFREFLRTVDLGRFAGDDLRTVFNRYFPYALALGLAERWAATFAAAGITPDRWYTNGAGDSTTGYLAFTAMANSVSTSPITVGPGTGSASFTSTSGFSGGGSGGGGVGSW